MKQQWPLWSKHHYHPSHFVYKNKEIHGYSVNIFSSSLFSKWDPEQVFQLQSFLSRTLDSWWTITHISLFVFFFSLLRSNSQQEIYWAANLLSSNWLRKNLNEFLNIQPKSIVTLFILGPRQIEIETINGNTSFWKNESWQLHSKHRIHTLTYSHVWVCACTRTRTLICSFIFRKNSWLDICFAY